MGYAWSKRWHQQKRASIEYDKATMATLIDKRIISGNSNKNHIIFWLDTDNDRMTAEGFCNMLDADTKKTANISNLTNGTVKSLSEWHQIAHPYEIHHSPNEFCHSR